MSGKSREIKIEIVRKPFTPSPDYEEIESRAAQIVYRRVIEHLERIADDEGKELVLL